ncbi:hypothetical protein ACF064_22810 [Streptomyces sp. NPDC015492]|uniref:hypothetical protein n=1 Tax=unclassified Streptomyces TaxID=2593676 RepID=UPI0036FCC345
MGKAEQFEDRSEQLRRQAMGKARDEASERATRERGRPDEETRRAQQEAQDRLDQDYDA